MKSPALKILALSIILGSFLRLYKLNTNYVWFNDTFFRLTPALEILQGVPVKYDSSMIGVTGLGLLCFSISKDLYPVVLAVCLAGILCIPLSYYFVLKLTKDERIAALTALFVSINPTLVALSKVLLWDIFVVFFFLVSGIVFLSLKEKESLTKGILLSISLFILFSFKLSNFLYAFIIYLFLFYNGKHSINKSRNLFASLIVYGLLMGLFFFLFHSPFGSFVGGADSILEKNYPSFIVATLKILASPLASPATSMAYPQDMKIDIFFIMGLVSLIPTSVYLKYIKKKDIFPISLVFIISLFFITPGVWSHRYVVVPLFLMLVFVSYGLIKIMEKKKMHAFLILTLCFIASFVPSITLNYEWNETESLAKNHVATPLSLFNNTCDFMDKNNVDMVVSSYGRVFTYYKLSGKIDTEIVDFYFTEKEDVLDITDNAISHGKRVWYIGGWPDVYAGWKPTTMYKNSIESEFILNQIYTSREKIYIFESSYPSLIVYELQNKN